jgi:probable blue pigment (indigoidine) exporter
MRFSHLVILLVLNFFWAATLSAYKIIGPCLSPGSIVTLRFGIAFLCLAFVWRWLPGNAPRSVDLVRACMVGVITFCAGQRLQVLGNQLGSAGNSSVLMGLEPLTTSVAAALFLREHIGRRRWIGFALGLTGVVLLNAPWQPGFRWTGLTASLIFVASFLGEAAYSVISKPVLARAGLMKVLAVALLAGTLANILVDGRETLAAVQRLPMVPWLLLFWLAIVCTVIGYGFWFVVIRESDVNVAALTVFTQPLFGVALAALWVGEPLHWGQLWGGLLIATGLAIGLSRQIRFARRTNAGAPG